MPNAKSLTYMDYSEPQLHSSDFIRIDTFSIIEAINRLSQTGVVTTIYDEHMIPIHILNPKFSEDFNPLYVSGVDYLINKSLVKIRNLKYSSLIQRDIELNSETIPGLKTLADFLNLPFDMDWIRK